MFMRSGAKNTPDGAVPLYKMPVISYHLCFLRSNFVFMWMLVNGACPYCRWRSVQAVDALIRDGCTTLEPDLLAFR
jgi:hypothetical protein